MKICILSMQQVNNMGSLLQAYALKSIIENLGHNVAFLDIRPNREENQLLGGVQLNFNTEFGKQGFSGKIRKIDKYFFNRVENKLLLRKQMEKYGSFRDKYIITTKEADRFDVAVIGSDEVFNCMDCGNIGFTAQLFGNIPEADKVITYAASCGATCFKILPGKVEERIRESFENVSAFSVRDKNTRDFVSKLTDREITENLDPVLIYDFEDEVVAAEIPELPDRYCIVYSYYGRINDRREIEPIKAFCRKNNMKTVAIGAPQFWCDYYFPCSPFECLKIFQQSSFVITDTFHGAIFSAKYANKFAVLIRESNRNKLTDLVERLQIKNHVVENMSELEATYQLESNMDAIGQIIKQERMKSIQYLQEQISNSTER